MANDHDFNGHLASIRADIGALGETISQLAGQTAEMGRDAGQRAGETARSALDAGEDMMRETGRLGGEAVHAAERAAANAVADIRYEIGRNPLVALALAGVVGLAVGFLSRGQRTSPTLPSRKGPVRAKPRSLY